MLPFVPFNLLLDHLIISLSPQLAKLIELVYLLVLQLHYAVFALSDLLTLLNTLFRAVFTCTTRAEVTMVSDDKKSLKLLVAELTIRLVLLWSLH